MYKVLDPKHIQQLTLTRNGWLSPEFELTDGLSNSYGKLSYEWISRRTAVAQCATATWRFNQNFGLSRSLTITDKTGQIIGEAKREFFSRITTLRLNTGLAAEFYRPFIFSRERIWEASGFGTVLRIRSYPFLFRDEIEVEQSMIQPQLIPLLIFLGAHLNILQRRRRVAH